MRQVRRVGWTFAIAAAMVLGGSQAMADIASDKSAAIVVYPKIEVNTGEGVDTVIRLVNTNETTPILAHCFYVNANSHCVGGSNDGEICESGADCSSGGRCVPGWLETDFRIQLTQGQPIQWVASEGLADDDLPLPRGACTGNPFVGCGSDADCARFNAGRCSASNAGTRIPPVAEDPFQGELKCIAIDNNGVPVPRNELKGEGILTTVTSTALDVASYNAIGIQATGATTGAANELVIGGPDPEYNGCPNYLIMNHFFEDVRNPVPGTDATIETSLVLVPCSTDYLRQIPGAATIQYLVFNEFEQRFSTSGPVICYEDTRLCNLDTSDCSRSIFNANVMGTVAGQTRLQAIRNPALPGVPSAVLGIGVERHVGATTQSAAFNLHQQGARAEADLITIP